MFYYLQKAKLKLLITSSTPLDAMLSRNVRLSMMCCCSSLLLELTSRRGEGRELLSVTTTFGLQCLNKFIADSKKQ